MNSEFLEELARRTIKGEFGNGILRVQNLGIFYKDVQERVNQIIEEEKSSDSFYQEYKEQATEYIEKLWLNPEDKEKIINFLDEAYSLGRAVEKAVE